MNLQQFIPEVFSARYIHAKKAALYAGLKGKKCLVVGCNKGRECYYFVRFGAAQVHGLDIIDDIGTDYKNQKVKYYNTSAENMVGLEDNYYDLVYSFATMEHISHIGLAFSEMVRVTKPGGIIFAIAGPLWHSKDGHHKSNFFKRYPWIHLRMNEFEINNYCTINHITDPSGKNAMKDHISYMLNPTFFNKLPARKYIELCANLSNLEIICNKLVFEKKKYLKPEIYSELKSKGYTREELLACEHMLIAKKLKVP